MLCKIRGYQGGDYEVRRLLGCDAVLQLPVTVNVVPSSLIVFILMTEVIRSSETSVLTTATRPSS
jgi:hypothetical protein